MILTIYRRGGAKTIADLEESNIRYNQVILVDRFAQAKVEVFAKIRVTMCIDDQPEMLKHVSAGVRGELLCNDGNRIWQPPLDVEWRNGKAGVLVKEQIAQVADFYV